LIAYREEFECRPRQIRQLVVCRDELDRRHHPLRRPDIDQALVFDPLDKFAVLVLYCDQVPSDINKGRLHPVADSTSGNLHLACKRGIANRVVLKPYDRRHLRWRAQNRPVHHAFSSARLSTYSAGDVRMILDAPDFTERSRPLVIKL
jgi:hypothetical protein